MTDLPMAGEAPPAADWTAQDGGDIPKILQDCPSCEAWVDVAFGEGGLFAQAFEGYEPRPGQIQLAKTFARAFETGKNAMAEGPTGTGKSFAYLVPAIYMAIKHHMPVVIATPVISLQEQLAEKDLPTLRRVLPFKFKFALFKGRGNFLCQKRFNEWHETWQNRSMSLFGEDEDDHPRQRQKTSRFASEAELINWAEVTQTGDKSEMRPEAADELWGEVCGSSDDCKCPKKGGCYYRTHKDEAEAAHVVVTNYHMLFTHLQLKLLLGVDALLGPMSIVVLDEAHEAADLARKFFGFELKASAVKRQSRMLDRAGAGALAAQLLTTFTQLTEIAVTKARQKRSGLVLSPSFGGTTTKELEQSLQRLLREAEAKWDDLAQEQQTAKLRAETDAKYGRAQAGAVKVAERLKKGYTRNATRCTTIRETLRQIQDVSPDPYNGKPWVYWLDQYDERAKPDQLTLNGQPIDVANYLHMTLYTWADSVVFTSATLTTGEADRFGYARGELGFQGEEVAVDSPFNYREQGILVIPDKKAMPAGPNDPAFQDQCARLMRQAIELARGRSLCLFTSYKNLNAVAAKLRDLPYKLLVQGDGMPRSRLIEEFKEDVSSVLLGVASLWQGLDVPGQACTVVLIDKLPFPGPDDPLGAWYEHSFDRDYAFRRYSMPRMLIRLRQGVGRLIRTRTDYGVVVILDSRIHTKPYGKTVLASLPPFGWIHPTVEAIKPFLEKWEPDGPTPAHCDSSGALGTYYPAAPAGSKCLCGKPATCVEGSQNVCDDCALPF